MTLYMNKSFLKWNTNIHFYFSSSQWIFHRTGNTKWNSVPISVSRYYRWYVLSGADIPNKIMIPIPIPNGWYRMTFSISLNFPRRQRIFIIYMSDRIIRHHTNNAWQVLSLSVRNCKKLLPCTPPPTSSTGCRNASGGTDSWQQAKPALFKCLNVSFHWNDNVYLFI